MSLQELYNDWRDDIDSWFSGRSVTDCRLVSARKDFSEYANLTGIISYEEMKVLEETFDKEEEELYNV